MAHGNLKETFVPSLSTLEKQDFLFLQNLFGMPGPFTSKVSTYVIDDYDDFSEILFIEIYMKFW